MTIALNLKINAGLVLAADSASVVMFKNPQGLANVIRIFENARKLFQIDAGPIGVLTWGIGSFGTTSVEEATLGFKPSPHLESVNDIAGEFRTYMKALYDKGFESWPDKPDVGFMICGFSHTEDHGAEFQLTFPDARLVRVRAPGEFGFTWNGQGDAITRLEKGYAVNLRKQVFPAMGITPEQKGKFDAMQPRLLEAGLFDPTMPLQDGIDLARFLVETTIKYEHFRPGAPLCGGAVDVAAITRGNGFRWVAQKSIR